MIVVDASAVLALARSLSSPAYTADRAWPTWRASLGVQVVLIR